MHLIWIDFPENRKLKLYGKQMENAWNMDN